MDQKKILRVNSNIYDNGKSSLLSALIPSGSNFEYINFGLTIYQILSYNPYEIAINLIAIKLGITNKIIIALIIAFIL